MAFCKEYNAATQEKMGQIIPVEITVFEVSSAGLGHAPFDWLHHVTGQMAPAGENLQTSAECDPAVLLCRIEASLLS